MEVGVEEEEEKGGEEGGGGDFVYEIMGLGCVVGGRGDEWVEGFCEDWFC